MDRIPQSRKSKVYVQWTDSDGLPAASTVPVTVEIDRADGTNLIAAGAATVHEGAGLYSYELTAADTADLDLLIASWTGEVSGDPETARTHVKVVGDVYFSLARARQLKELSDPAKVSTRKLQEFRALAEEAFERVAEKSFVPQYEVILAHGYGTTRLRIPVPYQPVRAIRSASIVPFSGEAATVLDVADLTVASPNVDYAPGWDRGFGNVQLGVEFGEDYVPPRVSEAVLTLAKNWLTKGPIDDRAIATVAGPDGGTIALRTPGIAGSQFGIPEVDDVANEYGRHPIMFDVAAPAPAERWIA